MLDKVNTKGFPIRVGNSSIHSSAKTRNLGIIFDTNMSFRNHICHVSRSIRYQLRNLGFVRKYQSQNATEQLVHALISSRLHFCNSLFVSLPLQQLNKLQRLQNSAARLFTLTKKTCHMTPVLKSLHWLPVEKRITFKVLLLVYHAVHGFSPVYIQNSIQAYTVQPSTQTQVIRLRSSDSSLLQVPRSLRSWGDHSFSHAGPTLWNSLPLFLRQASSASSFKQLVKTCLHSNSIFKFATLCDGFVRYTRSHYYYILLHYSKKLKEHVDIMIFIERYPLKRCQGCVKLIASKVNCFLSINDLSEVQLCMSSNSWT